MAGKLLDQGSRLLAQALVAAALEGRVHQAAIRIPEFPDDRRPESKLTALLNISEQVEI